MQQGPVVRAIDVGYGHVKWTDVRNGDGQIQADSFPSQAPMAPDSDFKTECMHRLDTFHVPVEGHMYAVGREVSLATGTNQELEQLDSSFALSAGYAARLFGALNYMLPGLGSNKTIDMLVLGLPLSTISQHQTALAEKFTGEFVINSKGDKINIRQCLVQPQPLGGYAYYLETICASKHKPPKALIVDPGYNTVDWFLCQGLKHNASVSRAVQRGVSAYLRLIAKSILKSGVPAGINETDLVRQLDAHYNDGEEFHVAGKAIELKAHEGAGAHVVEQAAQSVRDAVGAGSDVRVILMTGGGASLYIDRIREKFPAHEILVLPEPSFANVRGFHIIGEWLSPSASRAQQLEAKSA